MPYSDLIYTASGTGDHASLLKEALEAGRNENRRVILAGVWNIKSEKAVALPEKSSSNPDVFTNDKLSVLCAPGTVFKSDSNIVNMVKIITAREGFGRLEWIGGEFDFQNHAPLHGVGISVEGILAKFACRDAEFIVGGTVTGLRGDTHIFAEANDLQITGCTFHRAADSAVYVSRGMRASFSENRFIGCTVGIITKRAAERLTVSSNDFLDCAGGVQTGWASTGSGYEMPGRFTSVMNNTFKNCSGSCIGLAVSYGTTVIGNVIDGLRAAGSRGIMILGGNGAIVQGNSIYGEIETLNPQTGAATFITYDGQIGIYIGQDTHATGVVKAEDNIISNNIIRGIRRGIFNQATALRSQILYNKIYDVPSNGTTYEISPSSPANLTAVVRYIDQNGNEVGTPKYADHATDAAAATAGIPVDGRYRTGSALKTRVS